MADVKRILIGAMEICRQIYDFAEGFRSLGYQVDTIVGATNALYPNLRYSYALYPSLFPGWLRRVRHPIVRRPLDRIDRFYRWRRLRRLLKAYDLYIFLFGESLWPVNADLPMLKQLGKKVISLFVGSDIRHWSAAEQHLASFGQKAYEGYREQGAPLKVGLTKLRMAELYADAIFAQPSYAQLAVRPYHHFYAAIGVGNYKWAVPGRDVPVVVHAPSRRAIKGTKEILETLDRLKAEGVRFELRLLEGMPNEEVIRQLVAADVVVDELNENHYGMLGLEGMATGCAVAGGNDTGVVPFPAKRPVLPIKPDTIDTQVRRLLTDKDLRLRLAHEGRPFVEKYHDRRVAAQCLLDGVGREGPSRCDYRPYFFARDYRLPEGEAIGDDLKRVTAELVQRWGLPQGVDPRDMVERGLLPQEGLDAARPIPRWRPFPPPRSPEEDRMA